MDEMGWICFFFRNRLWSCIDLFNTHRATKAALRDLSDSRIRGFLSGKQKTEISFRMGKCIDLIWKGFNNPRLPKSSKYLLIRYLDPPKAFSGGVCGSKHLLTRHLEDWVNKYGCVWHTVSPHHVPTTCDVLIKFSPFPLVIFWGVFDVETLGKRFFSSKLRLLAGNLFLKYT